MPRFRLTPPRVRLSEKDVTKACLHLLGLRGYYVIRNQSGLFRTPDHRWIRAGVRGLPDYTALHPRWPGFLMELKRPGGQLSPEQVERIAEIRRGFGLALAVIDSVDALDEWLHQHERSP